MPVHRGMSSLRLPSHESLALRTVSSRSPVPPSPPRLNLPEPGGFGEVLFLRTAVARLTQQVESQGVLMDDMAAQLRRRADSDTGELPTEALLLQTRVRDAEAERARVEIERERLQHDLAEAHAELEALRAECSNLQQAASITDPAHTRSQDDAYIASQLSDVVAKLRRDLHESERSAIRERAERLGETRLISKELGEIAATTLQAMAGVGELSRAAHFLPGRGGGGGGGGGGGPEDGASEGVSDTVSADEAVLLAAPSDAWRHAVQALRDVAAARTDKSESSVRRDYLDRLSRGLDARMADGQGEGRVKLEAADMRREADRVLRDMQSEYRTCIQHLAHTTGQLCTAAGLLAKEAQASCEVFGIQSRALHHFREQCLVAQRSKALVAAEVERLQESLATEAYDAGSQLQVLRHRVQVVEEENGRLKALLGSLRLSDIDATALQAIGIDPDDFPDDSTLTSDAVVVEDPEEACCAEAAPPSQPG